jgi:glycosyltransferase involved in cell wall biosynthesis
MEAWLTGAMKLSVVVPVLNEARVLPALLESLRPLQRGGVEVVLVDGGSEDGSAAIATCAGFQVIRADRGRARQMNAGAAAVHGDVLLFLHADTRLPDDAVQLIEAALADGRLPGVASTSSSTSARGPWPLPHSA